MDKIVKQFSFWEIIIFTFTTMSISGASSFANNYIVKVFALVILISIALKKKVSLYNNTLVFIEVGWMIINLFASVWLNTPINSYAFIGMMVLIYTAYLILRISNSMFWDRYEHYLYLLVLISTSIYILSLFFPNIFTLISPYFRFFTDSVFFQKDSQQNYFYSFFFTYMGRDLGESWSRNAGFMWEPGAYALVLIVLILYNFAKNEYKLNKRIIVYTTILLTTASTMGYLALTILYLSNYLFKKNVSFAKKTLICATIGAILLLVVNVDFMFPKIQSFIEETQNQTVFEQAHSGKYEANRILSFFFLIEKFKQYPFGWGVVTDSVSLLAKSDVVVVNGLADILVTWGLILFVFFVVSIYKYYYKINLSRKHAYIAVLIIGIAFFSNPIDRNLILFLIIFSNSTTKFKLS